MTLALSPIWGPYEGPADARSYLCRFVDKVCAPDVGVAWLACGTLTPLRGPRRDENGFGVVAIFELADAPVPPPPRPTTFWGRLADFFNTAMTQYGEAQIAQGQAQMAAGQALAGAIGKVFGKHGDDAAGVALDIICVGLSIALFASGIGALGFVALGGGVILLGTDTIAYGMELSGDDERAEAFKKRTEVLRIVATVATLPDLAWGGFKAIREFREVQELRQVALATGNTTDALAARTQNAARAARYADIAERARLRAQIMSEQIKGAVLHEFSPRIAGAGSLGLLVREEWLNDESLCHQFLARLHVHCTAAHT